MDNNYKFGDEIEMNREKGKNKRPVKKIKLRQKESKPGTDGSDGNEQMGKKAARNLMLWLMIAVGFIILAQILTFDQKTETEVSFTEFKALLSKGRVESATIIENEFHGNLYGPVTIWRPSSRGVEGDSTSVFVDEKIKVILPTNYVDTEVLAEWDAIGLKYNFQVKSMDWVGYLLQMSPWILIFVFWFVLMRRMQGGGPKGIFSFGKSRAKVISGKEQKVTFDDVAGVVEAKQELMEIIGFLKEPE